MHDALKRPITFLMLFSMLLFSSGCRVYNAEIAQLEDTSTREIQHGLRAHTKDGKVLLFPEGAYLSPDSLIGNGQLYGLNLEKGSLPVAGYPRNQLNTISYTTSTVSKTESATMTALSFTLIGVAVAATLKVIAVASAFSSFDGTPDGD
ncbi:MAG: hypothetical protein AAF564_03245 [Bacteroidota bacterium]